MILQLETQFTLCLNIHTSPTQPKACTLFQRVETLFVLVNYRHNVIALPSVVVALPLLNLDLISDGYQNNEGYAQSLKTPGPSKVHLVPPKFYNRFTYHAASPI